MRIGVTGLARSGKTALLTSLAANLLAQAGGAQALPALAARLAGRSLRVSVAPSGAAGLPRFDYAAHLASLDADPSAWPARTDAASLLALDIEIGRTGFATALPAQSVRLELLDYPGEWLLDLPLLGQDFAGWSEQAMARLAAPAAEAGSREFRAFAAGLPASAPADEALAATGHRLFRDLLRRLRGEARLTLLQPGRFLMPAPGAEPPWIAFFPLPGRSPLAGLLAQRYDAYRDAVRRDLVSPAFGRLDRWVVLADLLSALHDGPAAFADAAAALGAVADALRFRPATLLGSWVPAALLGLFGIAAGIDRVAIAATKADHVADRQRGNLAALVANLAQPAWFGDVAARSFALAAVRCTEDIVLTLEGRPVSAVRGRVLDPAGGEQRPVRSYPGEVPDRPPDATFWTHPFLALPQFEPIRPRLGGRGGVSHIGLDALLAFLLEDVLG